MENDEVEIHTTAACKVKKSRPRVLTMRLNLSPIIPQTLSYTSPRMTGEHYSHVTHLLGVVPSNSLAMLAGFGFVFCLSLPSGWHDRPGPPTANALGCFYSNRKLTNTTPKSHYLSQC